MQPMCGLGSPSLRQLKEIGDIMRKFTILALSLVMTGAGVAWSAEDGATLEPVDGVEEAPVADGEIIDIEGDDHVHTSLFPLVKYRKHGDEERLKLVHVPFVSLVKAKKNDEKEEVSIVNVPFFKLVKSETHADGDFDNQVVKLPIIGALFRHKRTGNREKVRFLIFSHTRTVSDDEMEDAGEPRPRRTYQRRGKGGLRQR